MRVGKMWGRWRWPLVAGGLLAVGVAWGAAATRLTEADRRWRGGNHEEAVAAYHEIVKSYEGRTDLSDAERRDYAAALASLALGQVESQAAAPGADRQLKSFARQLAGAVGTRMLTEVSHGERVTLSELTAQDRPTMVYFGSPYCPPCMKHLPDVERLGAEQDEFAVVFVNVNRPDVVGIDWKSPVCKQFEIRQLPTIAFANPDGSMLAQGDDARQKYQEAVKRLPR